MPGIEYICRISESEINELAVMQKHDSDYTRLREMINALMQESFDLGMQIGQKLAEKHNRRARDGME
jgi:hypothetical protein